MRGCLLQVRPGVLKLCLAGKAASPFYTPTPRAPRPPPGMGGAGREVGIQSSRAGVGGGAQANTCGFIHRSAHRRGCLQGDRRRTAHPSTKKGETPIGKPRAGNASALTLRNGVHLGGILGPPGSP